MSDSPGILVAKGEAPRELLPRYANRHGLITGATGTGKTVTLQVIAEGLAARGVPAPEEPVVTDLSRASNGTAGALVWQSGNYVLGKGKPVAVTVAPTQTLAGPWQVNFQKDRGAPARIELPELQSLHLNSDPGVKYFSGTAAYTHNLAVPADFLRPGHRVILDLGRVEILARVFVNGRDLGVVVRRKLITDVVNQGRGDQLVIGAIGARTRCRLQ